MSAEPEFTAADLALLERIANRVVELRLEVPALLTLEGGRPLSFLAGQTMHFFAPLVGALLRLPEYQRFAELIERRETIDRLADLIEDRAESADAERRARSQAGRTPRAPRA